ncbi:Protein of unknown function [Pyronema omphalodes CBS 100304]|uniref:Uncharacterized protein n=1 Tax=Pyronema omphalodes (strain CBS 100304) TaxID=1076935 RepID=U4KYV8_PYROM|nr:Protein of unknown function [Pyronema omphalodes CBS 100304]
MMRTTPSVLYIDNLHRKPQNNNHQPRLNDQSSFAHREEGREGGF